MQQAGKAQSRGRGGGLARLLHVCACGVLGVGVGVGEGVGVDGWVMCAAACRVTRKLGFECAGPSRSSNAQE